MTGGPDARPPTTHDNTLPEAKQKAHWVEPRLLVDVEYSARTARSRLLRHPRYKGMREDLM
jgi:ATP-dependent DNA ligase